MLQQFLFLPRRVITIDRHHVIPPLIEMIFIIPKGVTRMRNPDMAGLNVLLTSGSFNPL